MQYSLNQIIAKGNFVTHCGAHLIKCDFAATPKPAIAGTFSVPPRMPLSCPPPNISGVSVTPSRIYKRPMPFGP